MRLESLIGQKFGRLTVIAKAPNDPRRRGQRWLCECECGNTLITRGDSLKDGNTSSCGCRYDETRQGKLQHGHCSFYSVTDEYRIWIAMKQRCLNPNSKPYHYYGGRGITVCQEWQDSFEVFFQHIGPRPSKKHSIDRIDNNGNYEPGNVRWATVAQQLANRRPRKDAKNHPERIEGTSIQRLST